MLHKITQKEILSVVIDGNLSIFHDYSWLTIYNMSLTEKTKQNKKKTKQNKTKNKKQKTKKTFTMFTMILPLV